MRSRALSMPAAVRFAYLSAPPPASALARRASYSFSNASNAMMLPLLLDVADVAIRRHDLDFSSVRISCGRQRRHDFAIIADDAEARVPEYRRLGVGVDRDDRLRVAAARHVMARAGDADREVQIRRHGLAGEADLPRMRTPAEIARHAARARPRAPSAARERLEHAESFRALRARGRRRR